MAISIRVCVANAPLVLSVDCEDLVKHGGNKNVPANLQVLKKADKSLVE